jgi:uncharacterized protein YbjT (DUF2867 family)
MYIILGATGHVGSALAQSLLTQDESVTIITHDIRKKEEWQKMGAIVAVADVHDTDRLRTIFQQGKRLFVLNPPAPITTDTAQQERKSAASILSALTDSAIQKIVCLSTYGAQPGEQLGDMGVLYELEQGLSKTGIPTSIIRAAYYMSNWDMSLTTAQQAGQVHTLFPPDFKLPMVAPQDIGAVGASLLQEPVEQSGLHYVEGPERYSASDVAAAFSDALGKNIEVLEIQSNAWMSTLQQAGFSQAAARSMAAMTKVTLEQKYELPETPVYGATTLHNYNSALVSHSR